MADMLDTGAAWLETMRRAHMTRKVLFRRGASSVAVLATVGKTDFRVDEGFGLLVHHESRDYLVLAADLILAAVTVTPQRGDQIVEETHVYEVMAPGGEPSFVWSDRHHLRLRIHTNYVGEEP